MTGTGSVCGVSLQDWLKDQEESSRERVQMQKEQWVHTQLQQQQLQYAADLEAIENDLHEKLQDLERKKSRGAKASAPVLRHESLPHFTLDGLSCWCVLTQSVKPCLTHDQTVIRYP